MPAAALCESSSGQEDCGPAVFSPGTPYKDGSCSDPQYDNAADCLKGQGGCDFVNATCSNGDIGGTFEECMAVTGHCKHTDTVTAQPAQCSCSDGSGFKGDGQTEEDCYTLSEQPQFCTGLPGDDVTQAECESARCFQHIASKCTDPDGTWSSSDGVDEAWCRDQTRCAIYEPSSCSNGDIGGVEDDCPTCYVFKVATCGNHNAEAVLAENNQVPFMVNLGNAATEELCDRVDDACIFHKRDCTALSPDYHTQSVTASTEEVCSDYVGGCTWNKAYTYQQMCTFTPAVEESRATCSDSVTALQRTQIIAGVGVHSHSNYKVSSAEFARVTEAHSSYTGSCTNGEKDGDETDTDCGGSHYGEACPACATTAAPSTTAAPVAVSVAPVTTTTAAPTEGPVTVSPAGIVTTSIFTLVLLAVSALFML